MGIGKSTEMMSCPISGTTHCTFWKKRTRQCAGWDRNTATSNSSTQRNLGLFKASTMDTQYAANVQSWICGVLSSSIAEQIICTSSTALPPTIQQPVQRTPSPGSRQLRKWLTSCQLPHWSASSAKRRNAKTHKLTESRLQTKQVLFTSITALHMSLCWDTILVSFLLSPPGVPTGPFFGYKSLKCMPKFLWLVDQCFSRPEWYVAPVTTWNMEGCVAPPVALKNFDGTSGKLVYTIYKDFEQSRREQCMVQNECYVYTSKVYHSLACNILLISTTSSCTKIPGIEAQSAKIYINQILGLSSEDSNLRHENLYKRMLFLFKY